tara:strand:+ start:4569 stop:5639 length:1071 start_codon:yes stop_codon:yes gene_type:complete
LTKNIFLIIPDLRCGGAEKVFINLANEWIKKHKVTFILMNKKGEMLKDLNSKINIINLEVDRIRFVIPKLIKIFSSHSDSYFISAMWPLNSVFLFSSLLGSRSNNYYITEHVNLSKSMNIDFKVPKIILKLSISLTYIFAKKIICVSKGVKKDLSDLSFFNINSKLITIYNPIIHNSPKILDINNKKINILSVGTLKKQKNHKLLLKSISLIDDIEKYSVDILGDGPLFEELKQYCYYLNIEKIVNFHGYTRDVDSFYRKADIFILSSIYEGFGNVLVEALNHGLKIISTDCYNGPKEILDGNNYGLLVPINDHTAMKNAIYQIQKINFDKDRLQERAKKFEVKYISNKYLSEMGI